MSGCVAEPGEPLAAIPHATEAQARRVLAQAAARGVSAARPPWAAIQAAVSDIDFDFWSWGMLKYDVARAAVLDGSLDLLIARLDAA